MWFIVKASRLPIAPYQGPTCERANVPAGKWYMDQSEAEKDAKTLSAYNPVGFQVYHESERVT